MSAINLGPVLKLLDRVTDVVEKVDGTNLDDSDSVQQQGVRNARQERALATRQLLALADQLEMASALIRNEYWKTKGFDDMLEG